MRSPLLAALCTVALALGCATPEDARKLHFDAIVIDTHSDTTPRFEDPDWAFDERHVDGHMDLPRIREGGLDVEFWSIYMGEQAVEGAAIRKALERIDAVHQMVEQYADSVVLAGSVAEIREGVAQGKLVSLMGLEGGHIIEESLPALRTFYRLGVRYMTLTHSFNTSWADSSGTREQPEPRHHGLNDFGREVVREMNRLGMLVDVSHVSDESFDDVIAVSTAPVIASHSSMRALADHTRNMSDAMLRALAENGGVVMINFYPAYIDTAARDAGRAYFREHGATFKQIAEDHPDDPRRQTELRRALLAEFPFPQCSLEVLLDHFDHAIAVAGPAHVGIGADWDGVPSMPVGMEDVSRLPALSEGLIARGHSPGTVRGVLGENLLRVMRDVEIEAARLRGP